jgi:hypothetical protein
MYYLAEYNSSNMSILPKFGVDLATNFIEVPQLVWERKHMNGWVRPAHRAPFYAKTCFF